MAEDNLKLLASRKCFRGEVRFYEYPSKKLNCKTKFGIFLPETAVNGAANVPYIMTLAGAAGNHETFLTKSSCLSLASDMGIALVTPDTSPRDCGLDPKSEYWLGEGASYYLKSDKAPWSKHYNMYGWVSEELPLLMSKTFGLDDHNKSVMGHSMGGLGALMLALKSPEAWKSASAFAPLNHPSNVKWGIQAGELYFNDPKSSWEEFDPILLLRSGHKHPNPLLIDQGLKDPNIKKLQPDVLLETAQKFGQEVILRKDEGFDHSYWFVQSFVKDHLEFHADYLNI